MPTSPRLRLEALWLAVVLGCCLDVTRLSAQVQFDAWTIADGLPQGSVYDIAQTPDGYLWLATLGGLVRFDGARFVVFDLGTEGIGSTRLRALLPARDGTLWIGSEDGKLIRHRDGRFETFDERAGMPSGAVLRLDEGRDGQVWVTLTLPDRVARFDGHTFATYQPGDLPFAVAPHRPAGIAGASALWWSLDEEGVHCLVGGVVELCLAASHLPTRRVIGVVDEQDGAVWIVTSASGAVRVRAGVPEPVRFGSGYRLSYGATPHSDGHGRLWIGEGSTGLVIAGPAGPVGVLSSTDPLSIFSDRQRNVWVGTTDGLRRVVEPVVTALTMQDGLSTNNVNPVLETRLGEVWVGTWGGGVNRIGDEGVTIYRSGSGDQAQQITALYEDRDGRMLVGTMAGLHLLTGRELRPYPVASRWPGGRTWAIVQDRRGALWFGTDDGLVVERDGQYIRYSTTDGLTDNSISALHLDGSDRLWIGTRRGVTVWRDDAVVATYTSSDGFIGSFVRAFHEDDAGVFWIGTYDGGLYRLQGDRLTRFTTRTGLYDNGVFQILDDRRGYFWMCSNRGIFRVRRAELDAYANGQLRAVSALGLGVRDGMVNAECNGGRQPGGIRRSDGTLWFPTQGGIAIVDPAALDASRDAPSALIEEVLLRGDAVALAGPIAVAPDRNSIEIRYTAPEFVRPRQTRFRYRLAGLDDTWIEAETRRSASYHLLPPGSYRFEVVAASSDGSWSESPARIDLVVLAPFWRQAWFLVLAGGGGLVVSGVVVRRRVRRLQRDRDAQRALSRRLLEVQEHERRRISQEMHDSLGQDLFMIKARARAGHEAAQDASTRETFEALDAMAAQSYAGMKQLAYSLRPFQLDKIGLARTVEGLVTRAAEAANLPLLVDVSALDELWSADAAIHIYRVVQEAVHNIVRHAGATAARISAVRHQASIELRVEDNGRGFEAARSEGLGFGLMTMRERALSLGGSLTLDSTPGSGTVVTLEVPLPRMPGP